MNRFLCILAASISRLELHMLLIIPAVDIRGGHCVQMVQGIEGYSYSDDPVEMARLWRKENAKSLHVTDVDGAIQGRLVNDEYIRKMVSTVDIPIELGGGLRSFDAVKQAFDIGVYRVLVSTMVIENPDEAKRVIETYGPRKVVLGIDALDGIVATHGWKESSGLTALSVALNAKALGFRRVVYTDIHLDGTLRGVNLRVLREIAEKTGMRVTSAGGISGLDDLLKVQELEKVGVDSVVIGRALYENKFSCQGIWRLCEAGNYPYTAKV
jgi:phosphoribosylformimino-5-aminoimidazole carboxamide ribotide isomerase